jgi:hypothetical protein
MLRSTNLLNSIEGRVVSASEVLVSTRGKKVPYARVHNEGLRVRGVRYVRGFHNNNFMGRGKRVQIKPHTRKVDFTMPKRQFMGWGALVEKRMRDRLILNFKQK